MVLFVTLMQRRRRRREMINSKQNDRSISFGKNGKKRFANSFTFYFYDI
jgi:hypothetical protein